MDLHELHKLTVDAFLAVDSFYSSMPRTKIGKFRDSFWRDFRRAVYYTFNPCVTDLVSQFGLPFTMANWDPHTMRNRVVIVDDEEYCSYHTFAAELPFHVYKWGMVLTLTDWPEDFDDPEEFPAREFMKMVRSLKTDYDWKKPWNRQQILTRLEVEFAEAIRIPREQVTPPTLTRSSDIERLTDSLDGVPFRLVRAMAKTPIGRKVYVQNVGKDVWGNEDVTDAAVKGALRKVNAKAKDHDLPLRLSFSVSNWLLFWKSENT
jgi:hypothetical protein